MGDHNHAKKLVFALKIHFATLLKSQEKFKKTFLGVFLSQIQPFIVWR
jgi:hypothetical protein